MHQIDWDGLRRLPTDELLHRVVTTTDRLGRRVDPLIVEPVAGMIAWGVATRASCQGHHDRGLPYPWVDVVEIEPVHQLLNRFPLPGWSVWAPGHVEGRTRGVIRLMPLPAAELRDAEVADRAGAPCASASLVHALGQHQVQLLSWGRYLLQRRDV